MMIPIETWAENNFSIPITKTTLIRYAKSGKIKPQPFKFAGRYVVDENAQFTPENQTDKTETDNQDAIILQIFNDGAS